MSEPIIDELTWRGLIAASTDLRALRAATATSTSVYAGFDPTAPSLHAGHLVPLLTLRRFQQAGHRPVVLAGGATGLIGDPREVGERTLNNADTVAEWTGSIRSQLERFVDFDDTATGALLVDNLDWTGKLTAIEMLRDVGKYFSVNVMLTRDVVRRRLDGEGISFTEFSYMLLQAHDFLHLRRNFGCTIQVGGSDQWGNIVAGVDLNRRADGAQVHGLTVPLVTSSDGTKFGKSTGGGSLWLDPNLTSPYAWYQYFLNTADADVIRYLRWFTWTDREELDELEQATAQRPQQRAAQHRLAAEMTTLVHGEPATRAAQQAGRALFGADELAGLDETTLRAALAETLIAELVEGAPDSIVDLLVATGLSESRGAARRTVADGGASVNNRRILEPDWTPSAETYLHGRWLVLRRGKRHVAGIRRG